MELNTTLRTLMTSSADAKILRLWLDRQASPHTRSCYRRDCGRLLAHIRKPLTRITLGDLQSFAQSLIAAGLSPISRARTVAATRSLFAFCRRMHYLPADPAQELLLPAYENRLAERIVGEEEVRRIIAGEPEGRNRVLLSLLYLGGLRVSEACQLRWRNLAKRENTGQITIFGKNGCTRIVLLTQALWTELLALRKSAGAEVPVFQSRSGKPLDRGRVRMVLLRAADRVGITLPISPHWLRHAHASHALDHGAPIHLVQATLGHSSVATTSRYLHARPGDSSARFLAPENVPPEFSKPALLVGGSGVMNVLTAASAAEGDRIMTQKTEVQTTLATASQPEQKARKKGKGAPRKPGVAPAKGKALQGGAPVAVIRRKRWRSPVRQRKRPARDLAAHCQLIRLLNAENP